MKLIFFLSLLPLLMLSARERPNILWIFSEDLSPYMGCYKDEVNQDHTPAIDKFAKEGVLFKRAFVTAPVCSASRSALITGVYQTSTGTHLHRSSRWAKGKLVPEEARIYLPEKIKTIPELFREAGYFTFNAGKDDYNFHYDRTELYSVGTEPSYQAGFNGWQGNHAVPRNNWTKNTWKARPSEEMPWFGQVMILGGKAKSKHVRKGEELAAEEVPVPPYFPDTPSHRQSWTQHYNAVRGADKQVEDILAQLEKDGELAHTIVFFFSDHGNNQSLRHKQLCYEGGLHIPLIIKGTHLQVKAGTVRDDLVLGLDISATTLALAGIKLPSYLQGRDLFAEKEQQREYIVSARDRCDFTIDRIRTVRSDKYRYIRNYHLDRPLMQPQYRDLKAEAQDLHRLHQTGQLNDYQEEHWFGPRPKEELYDLKADPHQLKNLAKQPAFEKELKKHRAVLAQWITETGDQGEQAESAASLKPTYDLWKNKPQFKNAKVNPEYLQFQK